MCTGADARRRHTSVAATAPDAAQAGESRLPGRASPDFASLLRAEEKRHDADESRAEDESLSAIDGPPPEEPSVFYCEAASAVAPHAPMAGATGSSRSIVESDPGAAALSGLVPADVEKFVSVVRTRILTEGGREASFTLNHPLFRGVGVRLQSDARGHLRAELFVPDEESKRRLEIYTGELKHLLRARGIEVAGLRVAIGVELAGSGEEQRDAKRKWASRARGIARVRADSSSSSAPGDPLREPEPTSAAQTYHA